MDSTIKLPARPRILVITLRRLGDVLLTTPLIRSIRRAWPDATIDALVFADTAGILAGNPDIDRVVAMPARPSGRQSFAVAASILRRYDLSVSTQTGDRPSGYAVLASSRAVAPVEDRFSGRLKKALFARSTAADRSVHRVEALLRLADVLGIPRVGEVVVPRGDLPPAAPSGPFAVIQASPMFTYKQWNPEGWRSVAAALSARGLTVVATGGPGEAERAYLDLVWKGTDVARLDGRCNWGQLSSLLASAKVYIGPDTSVTHLAAGAGCPTVALYGPTDPRLWGPYPIGGLPEAWQATAPMQNHGNVWIVQHAFPCTPCQLEGCERRLTSDSACLKQLPPAQVISAIEQALAPSPSQ
jgi:heptosyltransferase-3